MSRKRLSLSDVYSLRRGDRLRVENSITSYRRIGFGEGEICRYVSKDDLASEIIDVASQNTGRITGMFYWRFSRYNDDWWGVWAEGEIE